jgi:aminoglycoside phosphotransferase (APT) family kinase protein
MTDDTLRTTSAPIVTLDDVTTFLESTVGPDISPLRALRQGGWSNAYALNHAGETLVARFSAWRDDFANDRYAMRWHAPTLPVPEVTFIGEAPGGYCAISRFIHGVALDALDGAQMRHTLPAIFAMLDALRTADLRDTSGFGGWSETETAPFGSWGEFLLSVDHDGPDRRNYGWKAQLAASSVGFERFAEAYAVLERLVERIPSPRHLIHSDLLNYNVMVQPWGVTGVLDWGCGQFGDFLLDVAWFEHYWSLYPAWAEIDFLAEYRRHAADIGLDLPQFKERILACRLRIGLDDQAYNTYMRNWEFAELAAANTLALAQGWHD